MCLFDEYTELLDEINGLEEDDLPYAETQVGLIKEQIEAIQREIDTLENGTLSSDSPYIKSIIAKEISKANSDYKERLNLLIRRKQMLMDRDSENRDNLLKSIKGDMEEELTLKKVYNLINTYKDKLSIEEIEDLPIPQETHRELSIRSDLFEKHYNTMTEQATPFCKRLAEIISMKEIFMGITNPKVSVACMTAYVLIVSLISLNLPLMAIIGYVGVTCVSVHDALCLKDIESAIKKEFLLLEKSYDFIEKRYSDDMKSKVDEMNKKADKELEELVKELQEEEDKLKQEYQKLLDDLRTMENNPEFRASNLSIFQNKLNTLKKEKESYLEELEDNEAEYDDLRETIEGKKKKLKKLRAKIEDKYCSPLKPGTSRLIAKSLFLGFDKSEYLRLFTFNGKSSVVFYSGEVTSTTDLVLSLFVELLREVNIASLSIYIMDTKRGAPLFAPFTQEDLSEAIFLCSTKEQCMKVIANLHSEMEERNKSILAYASNIEEFNKQMIEKNSLTRDYKILLIQESSGAILSNPKFEQLLESGSDVGIIPIVFIPQSWYVEQIKGIGDEIESAFTLLSAIHQNWFQYSKEQDALVEKDKQYIQSNLRRLKTVLAEKDK